MKVLVTGVNGQLGHDVLSELQKRRYDVACLLADMVITEKYGYYHATNEGGYISWYEFACEIFKQAG